MNDTTLLDLGRHLMARNYGFRQPSVSAVKKFRRSPDHGACALERLFGWGMPVPRAELDGPLLDLLERTGVGRHTAPQNGAGEAMVHSALGAAMVGGHLCFHNAGPGAPRDAVFIGPDTYAFIEALERLRYRAGTLDSVLEIGCGSGAATLWLARRHPGARVLGCDVNPLAVRLARLNRGLGASAAEFVESDVLAKVDGDFDLIVSNPPFICDPLQRTYRDGGAMLGMALPLRIIRESLPRLRPGGQLLMFTASPVRGGEHVLAQQLNGSAIAHTLEELADSVYEELLGSAAYPAVERIAAVLVRVGIPA